MRFLQLVLAFVLVLSMLAPLYGLNFGEEPKRTNFDYSSVFSTVLGHLRHVEGEDVQLFGLVLLFAKAVKVKQRW